MVDPSKSVGIRNNNPCNIMFNVKIEWLGQSGNDGSGHSTFHTPDKGIRAAALDMLNYIKNNPHTTIPKMCEHWTGEKVENLVSYIQCVYQQFPRTDNSYELTVYDVEPLIKGIIKGENGIQPYDDKTILAGCAQAIIAFVTAQ